MIQLLDDFRDLLVELCNAQKYKQTASREQDLADVAALTR
jgi:hypothetical protein